MLDHTSGNDKDCDHVNKEYKGECFTCNAIQSAHSEPPINTIEELVDKYREDIMLSAQAISSDNQQYRESAINVAALASINLKSDINHLITQARIDEVNRFCNDWGYSQRENTKWMDWEGYAEMRIKELNNLQDIKEGE